MISLKTESELDIMRIAGRISAQALAVGGEMVRPGVTTAEINSAIHKFIVSQNAIPSFLGYGGFPASACISVNNEVIHGIPGSRVVNEGDIVSIDVGAIYNGFHGDNAWTFGAGSISEDAQRLLDITQQCLANAIAAAVDGARIGDVGWAVQSFAEENGLGVVRNYVGHGIGSEMHQPPEVPNLGPPGRGPRLVPGMTIAIEPMINLGTANVRVLDDDWTVVTADGSLSAHFENTIAITKNGPVILTSI